MRQCVDLNLLAPLDGCFTGVELVGLGPVAAKAATIDGKLYGIPWNVDVGLLYRRQDLLKSLGFGEPPLNWSELEAQASKVTSAEMGQGRSMAGFVWQGQSDGEIGMALTEAYAQAAGRQTASDRNAPWEKPWAQMAMERLRVWISGGFSPRNTLTNMSATVSLMLFEKGGAVFMRHWASVRPRLEGPSSVVSGKYSVSPLPGRRDGMDAGMLQSWNLAMGAKTRRREETMALVRYLTSAAVQARLAARLGWYPSRLGAYDDLAVTPRTASFYKTVREALITSVACQGGGKVGTATCRIVRSVLAGKLEPATGAALLVQGAGAQGDLEE